MKPLSTAQVLRLVDAIDRIAAQQRVARRCALKATEIGNRSAAMMWSSWASKAEGVLGRLRNRAVADQRAYQESIR